MAISDPTVMDATEEGVFGPEIWLNHKTGACCLKFDDGSVRGAQPSGPLLNAFFVWVGVPVVVVSEGVQCELAYVVATGLRAALGRPDLSVVFTVRSSSERVVSVSRGDAPVSNRNLARAGAFVVVQCGWSEDPEISITLDDELHYFSLSFREMPAGRFLPTID